MLPDLRELLRDAVSVMPTDLEYDLLQLRAELACGEDISGELSHIEEALLHEAPIIRNLAREILNRYAFQRYGIDIVPLLNAFISEKAVLERSAAFPLSGHIVTSEVMVTGKKKKVKSEAPFSLRNRIRAIRLPCESERNTIRLSCGDPPLLIARDEACRCLLPAPAREGEIVPYREYLPEIPSVHKKMPVYPVAYHGDEYRRLRSPLIRYEWRTAFSITTTLILPPPAAGLRVGSLRQGGGRSEYPTTCRGEFHSLSEASAQKDRDVPPVVHNTIVPVTWDRHRPVALLEYKGNILLGHSGCMLLGYGRKAIALPAADTIDRIQIIDLSGLPFDRSPANDPREVKIPVRPPGVRLPGESKAPPVKKRAIRSIAVHRRHLAVTVVLLGFFLPSLVSVSHPGLAPASTGRIEKIIAPPLRDPVLEHPEERKVMTFAPRHPEGHDNLRYLAAEEILYATLRRGTRGRPWFATWFDAAGRERQRGFVLFIRSAALSDYVGDRSRFSDAHWLSVAPENTKQIMEKFLRRCNLTAAVRDFETLYRGAEKQRTLFLGVNSWLKPFLGKNYRDLEEGLLIFLAEHSFSHDDIHEKAAQLSALRDRIVSVSDAIMGERERPTRLSPKKTVSDAQIREIVTGAFLGEIMYGVPAEFITLITAYETNFSMAYWRGGLGATQQTLKSANTVLQSSYWRSRLNDSAGVFMRHQLVPLSALDNILLCMTEAAKTIAIKAAELRIKAGDVVSSRKVSFKGKKVSAIWATAYKYNGNRKHARLYAGNVQRFYHHKTGWLKAFSDKKRIKRS